VKIFKLTALSLLLLVGSAAFAQEETLAKFFIYSLDGKKVKLKFPEVTFYSSKGNVHMAFIGIEKGKAQINGKVTLFKSEDIAETNTEYAYTEWIFEWVDIINEGTLDSKNVKVEILIIHKEDKDVFIMHLLDNITYEKIASYQGFKY